MTVKITTCWLNYAVEVGECLDGWLDGMAGGGGAVALNISIRVHVLLSLTQPATDWLGIVGKVS